MLYAMRCSSSVSTSTPSQSKRSAPLFAPICAAQFFVAAARTVGAAPRRSAVVAATERRRKEGMHPVGAKISQRRFTVKSISASHCIQKH